VKPAYILALIILVVSIVATLLTFAGSIAHHVTIPEAMAQAGQQVQVPGKILKDTVSYDPARQELRFDVQEMNGTGRITIVYGQPKPENFDSATSVEAVGIYRNGVFYASNLLVKCPSKYNDQKPVKTTDSGIHPAWALVIPGAVGAGFAVAAYKRWQGV
jgi:cytochrome c-type biogenesis protein CcmE